MTAVKIHPSNTPSLLERQYDELRAAGRVAMVEALRETAQEMSHLAPGHLSQDIAEHVTTGAGVVYGAVFPTASWAKYVEEGTGLYVEHHSSIRPLVGRRVQNPRAALKLKDGRFRRSVRGQRPQRFVARTRETMEGPAASILERPAMTVTGRLASR